MKRIYIAGKYTAPTRGRRITNTIRAEHVGRLVFALGAYPVIPHRTEILLEDINGDWETWMAITSRELSTCDGCVVVPGWETSDGTTTEIKQCKREGRPVFYWGEPGELERLKAWLEGLG